jgi:hypothetical protein
VPLVLLCIIRKALARFPPESKQAIDQAHETQSGFGTVQQYPMQRTRKRRRTRAIPDFAYHNNNNNFLTSTVGLTTKIFSFFYCLILLLLVLPSTAIWIPTCHLHRIPPLIALFSKQLFPFYHFVIYLV